MVYVGYYVTLIHTGKLGTTQSECENHGCCWAPGQVIGRLGMNIHQHTVLFDFQNEAYCFFPTPTYVVQSVNQTALGFTVSQSYLAWQRQITNLAYAPLDDDNEQDVWCWWCGWLPHLPPHSGAHSGDQ